MGNYTREQIIDMVDDEDVEFIRLQFTDMFGNLKNIAVTSSQLEKALDNLCTIDGSSIEGYGRRGEEDLYLHPDLNTFCILPWRPQQGKVARFLCDVYRANGKPLKESSRYIYQEVLEQAKEMGYTFHGEPECEFFLFHTDENGIPTTLTHEKAGYLDIGPMDLGENARRDIVLMLEEMGFGVASSHHEVAPAQHEIDLCCRQGIDIADDVMTFKMAVRTIAKRHGLHATFMPKPKEGVNGSGMHIKMVLMKDGRNAFSDERDKNGLSKEAYYFIGGILKHVRGMALVANPLVNSYKRLVPGFEAPTAASWSVKNGSHLIRIPSSKCGECRIELKSPDAAANPYLTLAICLAAGLEGIRKEIVPPAHVEKPFDELSLQEQESFEKLPLTMGEALEAFTQDPLMEEVLGKEFCRKYVEAKQKEWKEYTRQVSRWELERYLYCN